VFAANAMEHHLGAEAPEPPLPVMAPEILGQLNIVGRMPAWEETCRKIRSEEALRA